MENKKDPKRNYTIIIKIIAILVMILLLMIPNMLIQNLIYERKNRKLDIERDVAKSHGESQAYLPPILCIPFKKKLINSKGVEYFEDGIIRYAPEENKIDCQVNTEIRQRSIYDIIVYETELDVQTNIAVNLKNPESYWNYTIDYTKAFLTFGLTDMNGISDSSKIIVNGNEVELDGIFNSERNNQRYIKTKQFKVSKDETLDIQSQLFVSGTKSIFFEPIGDKMEVNMNSEWKDPSFVGSKLPVKRDISETGFTAYWATNNYSHSYPKNWTNDSSISIREQNGFGTNLIQPIDEYGKNSRTIKYALLIIALTFGIFFFFEILFKKMVHPIQYTLIGFALTVFYLLLLSITEHLGFDKAYLISSTATIGLIVGYSASILKSKKATAILLLLLAGLFAYIFIILQMSDFALLAGALALFAVLATVMILSRKIDWYNLTKLKAA